MKVFQLLIFILLLLTGCTNSNINDKDKRNLNWIWWQDAATGKSRWIPVSDYPNWQNGLFTRFYKDGGIYSTGKIRNGKEVDTTIKYSPGNHAYAYQIIQPGADAFYFIKDGPVKIYTQEHVLIAEGIITNHTYGDKWIRYYWNNIRKIEEDYHNGTGWQVSWYESGHIKDSSWHIAGHDSSLSIKTWYDNGQVKEINHWNNDLLNGITLNYFENGRLHDSSFFKDGNREGLTKQWYETGELNAVATFVNNKKNGLVLTYFKNGRPETIVNYKNGIPDGEIKKFAENGELVSSFILKDGERIK